MQNICPTSRTKKYYLLSTEDEMTIFDRIEMNPKVMLGKPVIQGTRVTVELIVRKVSEGMDEKELLAAYPNLKKGDVAAALRYAADTIANEETVVFEPVKDIAV